MVKAPLKNAAPCSVLYQNHNCYSNNQYLFIVPITLQSLKLERRLYEKAVYKSYMRYVAL